MRRILFLSAVVLVAGAAVVWVSFVRVGRERPSTSPGVVTATLAPSASIRFEETGAALGIDFEYERGDTGKFWMVETEGGGVSSLDYDLDGRMDLFWVNGCRLPPDSATPRHFSELFRNSGQAGFQRVAEQANLQVAFYGQGSTIGDYDNDGFADIFATGWLSCFLLQNQGDGTFRDVTSVSGCRGGKWNTGCCFADFDRDGNLDLFIANFVDFDPSRHEPCRDALGAPEYCGPSKYPALPDYLYRNLGDGHFEDQSESSGVARPNGPGFGGVAADADNDGWPDLLVANDRHPTFFFRNDTSHSAPGRIRLTEVAEELGIARNAEGIAEADMGIACGDFDGNGYLDYGLSHYYLEHFTLFRNLGPPGFLDVTHLTGLGHSTRDKLGWGTGFLDADYDGWLDLFIVNGHINDHPEDGIPYRMTAQFFRNRDGERFEDVSASSGDYFQRPCIARGTTVADLNEDGKEDLAVVHHHEPSVLLYNRSRGGHRVVVQLVGVRSNRDGTNARLEASLSALSGAPTTLMREVIAGEGYLGSNDKRTWIGIGAHGSIDRLRVRWATGIQTECSGLIADSEYLIVEGREPILLRRWMGASP